jgi:hypothetical protein
MAFPGEGGCKGCQQGFAMVKKAIDEDRTGSLDTVDYCFAVYLQIPYQFFQVGRFQPFLTGAV